MSLRRRKSTACQDCGNRTQLRPTELLIHQYHGELGYWRYMRYQLCPVCQGARLDWFFQHGKSPQLVHAPR